MVNHIESRQAEIIEEFSFYDDWMDRYQEIIDMAKDLEPLPYSDHNEENLIKGCQSRVWLTAALTDGKVIYRADSDAIITKGLVAMMLRILSDSSPEEIVKADLHFIKDIGLQEHLSPTRSNGLAAMVKRMKVEALAMMAK